MIQIVKTRGNNELMAFSAPHIYIQVVAAPFESHNPNRDAEGQSAEHRTERNTA
jgi:hypothetical protein